MKKSFVAVAASALLLPLFADEAASEEKVAENKKSPFGAEVTIDFLSDYMWRGTFLDRNPVYQPSVTLSYDADEFGTFLFNYWTSLDLTHKRNNCAGGGNSRRNGSMIEQDFYIAYANSYTFDDEKWGSLDYEIGHYWYDYPYNGPKHHAGSLGSDLYGGIFWNTPIVTLGSEVLWGYYTAHEHEPATAYFRFSVAHDFEIEQIEGLTITPKATLGVGNVAFVQNNTGIRDASTEMTEQTLTLKASYAITDHLSVGANINYTWTPSRTLRHARYMSFGDDNSHQVVWGGVSVTLSF